MAVKPQFVLMWGFGHPCCSNGTKTLLEVALLGICLAISKLNEMVKMIVSYCVIY